MGFKQMTVNKTQSEMIYLKLQFFLFVVQYSNIRIDATGSFAMHCVQICVSICMYYSKLTSLTNLHISVGYIFHGMHAKWMHIQAVQCGAFATYLHTWADKEICQICLLQYLSYTFTPSFDVALKICYSFWSVFFSIFIMFDQICQSVQSVTVW